MDSAIYGFAGMFAWGVADMLARYASVRVGSIYVALVVQVLGIAAPLLAALFFDTPWRALGDGGYVALAVLASLLFSVGYVAFYRGLERGMVSIVSPLSASWLVVTTILTSIFFDEVVGPVKWLLIFVILVGILLTSSDSRRGSSTSGVWYGIAAMVMFGVAFTLWKPMVEDVGPFLAVISVKFISAVLLSIYVTARRSLSLQLGRSLAALLAGAAVLDSLGFVAVNLGIESNPMSLIIPIAAAYPAVTLVLAWVLLKERVSRVQVVGIVAVLGGVVAFSAVT